jgi:chitin deacetylase
MSVAQLDGQSAYQNADGDDGTVQLANSVLAFGDTDDSSSPSTSPSLSTNSSGSGTAGPLATPVGSSVSGSPIKPSASGSKVASSVGPSPTAASQHVSSASLMVICDVRSVLGSVFALLVSALALV